MCTSPAASGKFLPLAAKVLPRATDDANGGGEYLMKKSLSSGISAKV